MLKKPHRHVPFFLWQTQPLRPVSRSKIYLTAMKPKQLSECTGLAPRQIRYPGCTRSENGYALLCDVRRPTAHLTSITVTSAGSLPRHARSLRAYVKTYFRRPGLPSSHGVTSAVSPSPFYRKIRALSALGSCSTVKRKLRTGTSKSFFQSLFPGCARTTTVPCSSRQTQVSCTCGNKGYRGIPHRRRKPQCF